VLLMPSVETAPNVFVDVVVVVVVDVEVDVFCVVAGAGAVVGWVVDGCVVAGAVVGVGWVVDGCVVVAGASVVVGLTTTVFPALPVVLSRL
jgi:hypothetical protein